MEIVPCCSLISICEQASTLTYLHIMFASLGILVADEVTKTKLSFP